MTDPLAQLAAGGATAKQIARALSWSASKVRYQAKKAGIALTPGKSKFNNTVIEADGQIFHSKGEFRRWRVLQALEQAGKIRNLRRQVPFKCEVDGTLICIFVADATCFDVDAQEFVIDEYKGDRTPVYRLKRKLVMALHRGWVFREIRS